MIQVMIRALKILLKVFAMHVQFREGTSAKPLLLAITSKGIETLIHNLMLNPNNLLKHNNIPLHMPV